VKSGRINKVRVEKEIKKMNLRKTQYFSKLKRLWKSIGIFEFLVGLVILLALIFVVFQTRSKEEWVEVEVKISSSSWWQAYFISPPFWLGESVGIGDQEFDSMGKEIAEVLDIKVYELRNEGGEEKTTRKDYYLTLNLKVVKDRRTKKLNFKNKPLEIGIPIEFHLENTFVLGLVTYIKDIPDTRKTEELIIEGTWMNTFPWHAEAIQVGGEMRDGSGRVVAKILDKQINLADMIVTTDDGRVLIRKNPLKRDVSIKARILVRKVGENYYFREDQKVKIGENLFIHLPEVDVNYISIMKVFDKEGNRVY